MKLVIIIKIDGARERIVSKVNSCTMRAEKLPPASCSLPPRSIEIPCALTGAVVTHKIKMTIGINPR